MVRLIILVGVSLLSFVPFGVSSPVDGGLASRPEIGGGQTYSVKKSFRAGERAAVLALIQAARVDASMVNLSIAVYDKKGTLVVEDKAVGSAQFDFATVFWYPPRDGDYTVEVSNTSSLPVPIWVAVK